MSIGILALVFAAACGAACLAGYAAERGRTQHGARTFDYSVVMPREI